jgi:hypothetical protein
MCYRVVFVQRTNWCQLSGVLPKIEMEMIEQYNIYRIPSFQASACHIKTIIKITCSNRENGLNFTIETNPEREGISKNKVHR